VQEMSLPNTRRPGHERYKHYIWWRGSHYVTPIRHILGGITIIAGVDEIPLPTSRSSSKGGYNFYILCEGNAAT
jgi:hypothetical protein